MDPDSRQWNMQTQDDIRREFETMGNGPPNMPPTDWKSSAERVARKLRRAEAMLRLAFRKHHMDDESIGWDELSDAMASTLAEFMGDRAFQEWMANPENWDDRAAAFMPLPK